MGKLLNLGIGILAAGAVGIIFAVTMEIATDEPIYFIIMKATALCFGVGGALMGIAALSRRK